MNLSPRRFLKESVSTLPVHKSYINADWKDSNIASITLSRKQADGNITFCAFMIDLSKGGIPNTFYLVNQPEEKFKIAIDRLIYSGEGVEIEQEKAENMILTAIQKAENLGIKSHRDLPLTLNILENMVTA